MKLSLIALSAIFFLIGCSTSPKNDFINACTQSNSQETCSCMYNELEGVYGKKGMKEIGMGNFPDDFEQTIDRLSRKNSCM